jgi:hypothetical protein
VIAFSDSDFFWVVFKVVAIIATELVLLLLVAWVAVKRWPSE